MTCRALILFSAWLLATTGACRPRPAAMVPPDIVTVTILATSDVHGWMRPRVDARTGTWEGGLEPIVALWQDMEGVDVEARQRGERGNVLILDSGDMWTGPPTATLTRGRPIVDIYGAVGYDAAVIGNHEFDFGVENLREQARRARFPFLGANMSSPDSSVDLGFRRSSLVVDMRGIRVGIIGLAFRDTPVVTFRPNVAGLAFGDYEPALRLEARRLLEEEDAQVLIVLVHDGIEALRTLARATADLPIRVFLGGHTHVAALEVLERDPATPADDVILSVPRSKGRCYSRLALRFRGAELVGHAEAQVAVGGNLADGPYPSSALVAAIAGKAEAEVGPTLNEVVGVARESIEVGDRAFSPLGVLVAESWLAGVPGARLAITNIGGIRQPIDAGEVTVGDILGVLPFTNHLVLVRLTGAQIKEVLANPLLVLGGGAMDSRAENGARVVDAITLPGGTRVEDGMTYGVVTTDFLYTGGDGAVFARMDPNPRWLAVGWREPVLALFRSRGREGVAPPVSPRAGDGSW